MLDYVLMDEVHGPVLWNCCQVMPRNAMAKSQHLFRQWHGDIGQQNITWANVDPGLCFCMPSVGYNQLIVCHVHPTKCVCGAVSIVLCYRLILVDFMDNLPGCFTGTRQVSRWKLFFPFVENSQVQLWQRVLDDVNHYVICHSVPMAIKLAAREVVSQFVAPV